LRSGLQAPELQLAVLDFLCAYEPDLVAAAESLDVAPATITAVRERLAR
jgi:hypothetical protein